MEVSKQASYSVETNTKVEIIVIAHWMASVRRSEHGPRGGTAVKLRLDLWLNGSGGAGLRAGGGVSAGWDREITD